MPYDNVGQANIIPDLVFEVSWEVCNKIGGIHTVIATKAPSMKKWMGDNYITIGPDIHFDNRNSEFEEDPELMKEWRRALYESGIRIRVGRWKIKGSPIAILVNFSSLIPQKDTMLKSLWDNYRVDSISGQWDYVEPFLFGCAAGKVIENYLETFGAPQHKIVAQFHEWMTGSGALYLRKYVPFVATVFTTHATVLGRALAANGQPLYGNLRNFKSDEYARMYNVTAKHSMEKISAAQADCFATVSGITAEECKYLLGQEADIVTPNGFEDNIVWKGAAYDRKRAEARKLMIRVTEACLGVKFGEEPLIVGTGGRYEFRNKGLDVFIESLKELAEKYRGTRDILAFIAVPAGNNGPRQDLAAHLADPAKPIDGSLYPHTTHVLSGGDPIVDAMRGSVLETAGSRVKVLFVPSYLNGSDGIFNKTYYELLAGMDLTVFASYYEPWGYTPLESVAFSVPTITTTLAGFGAWVQNHMKEHQGMTVIPRDDGNAAQVAGMIARTTDDFAKAGDETVAALRASALEISKTALWKNLIKYYKEAYSLAIRNAAERTGRKPLNSDHIEQAGAVRQLLSDSRPVWRRLMVEKKLPERLHALEVLSRNLWWSWARGVHDLFEYVHPELWNDSDKNPIELLDKLDYDRIRELMADEEFLSKMDDVYASFLAYMGEKDKAKGPAVAYFCMEYGLHSSLKMYSGGLGVLAGDYLKEASDMNVPMVAIGLLYRYGYFTQKLSSQGAQEVSYEPQNFFKLPISPVRNPDGSWKSIRIAFPGRTLTARIWKCEVGRTDLYLLDADHDLNLDEDRSITHHLYGGDWENRLKQEILLGVGGIRALRELGVTGNIYHCNEGHAAFLGFERIRGFMERYRLTFGEALEVVRSSSLFTTHTAVPAGHDAFPESMIRQYMAHYPERLGITWEQFINLGKTSHADPEEKFSMSVLAANLSQEMNGVSRIHCEVTREIFNRIWPGYFKDELHIGYVTNGIHFPTWTAPKLRKLYARFFPDGVSGREYDIPSWQKVRMVADEELWSERMFLKNKLVRLVRRRMGDPAQFKLASPGQMIKIMESFRPDVLTIGFSRRFATYKRADLLFTNLDRLDSIVNNPQRPVQFVFAGKAHPDDIPGQDLIKRIVEVANMPRFAGKVVFLQNYDMLLARYMIQGVDVWLNTPTRRMEASGTSGEKAVMNGVLQFSTLDGWWVEGFREGAGWSLPQRAIFEDPGFQNELDAEIIYTTIEQEIAPRYYTRNEQNIPRLWLEAVKQSVGDIAPRFTTNRMLADYRAKYYDKLHFRTLRMRADDFAMARGIAAWKREVCARWPDVRIVSEEHLDMNKQEIVMGRGYKVMVEVDTGGLKPDDIGVEMVVAKQINQGKYVKVIDTFPLRRHKVDGTLAYYGLTMTPPRSGTFDIAIRVYPKNDKLPHRMDFPLVKWE